MLGVRLRTLDRSSPLAPPRVAGARRWAALLALLLVSLAGPAHAARVVVFGLDPRGLAADAAESGNRALLDTLRGVEGLEVVDAELGRARLGVDLTDQARACDYDVFCLVEVGELLQSGRVLIGHLSRPAPTDPDADEGLELKLVVIDVAKATITEVLLWRVPDLDPDALREAAGAAARRLFAPPDVRVQFDLRPPGAKVRFYEEPLDRPTSGTMNYWSGVYHARVEAEGYVAQQLRVRLPRGQAKVRVAIELQPDLLYVKKSTGPVKVFDKSSRRIGSGASAKTAGAEVAAPTRSYAHESALPWITAGAGVGLAVLGGVLMQTSQSGYNDLATQRRYTPGATVTADVAMRERDRQRSTYRAGSGVLIGGVAALVGAAAWMLVDIARAPDPEPTASAPPPPARPAQRAAARTLAQELHR